MSERAGSQTGRYGKGDRPAAALYSGWVVHSRLRPVPHKLRYRVFSLLIDVDQIGEVARKVAAFSYNKTGLISIFDRDFGDRREVALAERARAVLAENGLGDCGARIELLAYPRIAGAVFNPLSVYYCYRACGMLGAVIHEVTNTFGERVNYVIPVDAVHNGVVVQAGQKSMSVSPFTHGRGAYGFRLTVPEDTVAVGVSLRDGEGPIIKTHFAGERAVLTSAEVMRQFWRTPFLTQRVVGAIHWEALKLWWKGAPVIKRHRSPPFAAYRPRPVPEE